MAQQAYPTVQNEPQSWANIGLELQAYDGPTLPLPDIKGVKWSVGLEASPQRRTDGSIKGYGRGQATPDGSIELYAGGTIVLIRTLIVVAKAKGFVDGSGAYQYGRVLFDLPIIHTPYGETEIRKVKLIGCRIKKDGLDSAEGTDIDSNELELLITRVEREIGGDRAVLL